MAESLWSRKAHVGPNCRRDLRFTCTEATVIDVLSPRPRSSVQARVLDSDSSGLKLGLAFPLSAGALIRALAGGKRGALSGLALGGGGGALWSLMSGKRRGQR